MAAQNRMRACYMAFNLIDEFVHINSSIGFKKDKQSKIPVYIYTFAAWTDLPCNISTLIIPVFTQTNNICIKYLT